MQKTVRNNISEKFSWQAKKLVPADLDKACLCMEIGADSLGYAVFSPGREPLVLKSLQNKQFTVQANFIEGYFDREDILQHSFAKVLISIRDVPYTLVPRAFYKEEDKELFLKFNCGPAKNTVILTDEVQRMDAKLLYAMDADLKKNIDKLFPSHHTKSAVSLLIDHSMPEKTAKDTAFLHFRKDAVDLVVYRNSPLFCNSFSVLSPEDLLYFVLASFEQFAFDPATVKLVITGETETNSFAVKLLTKYIKSVSFALIDRQFKKPLDIPGMPSHYYYHLLNRIQCE
ncbi:MAG: hypothetical protein K0S33_397 [Bacteroidetes bacterium]|jgi:hypothetical protein|nr:hypothetical protein [Bacteroidota bacterium]